MDVRLGRPGRGNVTDMRVRTYRMSGPKQRTVHPDFISAPRVIQSIGSVRLRLRRPRRMSRVHPGVHGEDQDDEPICTPECRRCCAWTTVMVCLHGWLAVLFLCVWVPLTFEGLEELMRVGLAAGLGCGFLGCSCACFCCCCWDCCCRDPPKGKGDIDIEQGKVKPHSESLRRSALEPERRRLSLAAKALQDSWLPEAAKTRLSRSLYRVSSGLETAEDRVSRSAFGSSVASSVRRVSLCTSTRSACRISSSSSTAITFSKDDPTVKSGE